MLELLYFAIDMALGGKYEKTMLVIIALSLWYLVGLWNMIFLMGWLLLTLTIISILMIIGMVYIASNNKD